MVQCNYIACRMPSTKCEVQRKVVISCCCVLLGLAVGVLAEVVAVVKVVKDVPFAVRRMVVSLCWRLMGEVCRCYLLTRTWPLAEASVQMVW